MGTQASNNYEAIGDILGIRREIKQVQREIDVLKEREKELEESLIQVSKKCIHRNADGTSAIAYVGPGYDGCNICGVWF